MGSTKRPTGSIHRIREFELEKVVLGEEFDILQIVGEGWFGKILLVEHRATDTEMVLKALPKPYVSLGDFYREFHYGLHLGAHKNIVTTYDIAFETAGFYVFTQEYAPLGDLTSNVSETGIGELHTKRVAKQIASALDYMHSKDLVHRDVKLDNVLVCKSDFSRVKLCDFGESRRSQSTVQRRNEWLPYSPPEVLQVSTDSTYKTDHSHDVWQFGIVIFVCLTGCLPWQKAASDDPRYVRYLAWHNSNMMNPIRRTPKLFKMISSKACRMFRKFLEPNEERRPKSLGELSKFFDDRWLTKGGEKDLLSMEPDELCPSMYSFHSSPEEKDKLLSSLAHFGIETTVDRLAKKNRIRDWIATSVIMEEEEEEDDSGTATPSSTVSRTPVAGHVSSVRAMEEAEKIIHSTVKDASKKHIDPRTGEIQQGPSAMGSVFVENNNLQQNGRHSDPDIHNYPQQSTQASRYTDSQNIVEARLGFSISPAEPVLKGQKDKSSSTGNLNGSRRQKAYKSTSTGLISAFNSVATITVPETVANKTVDNVKNPVKDSGYGSSTKINTSTNDRTVLSSPVMNNRSQSMSQNWEYYQHSADNAHFDSDDVESPRGSNGFVHLVGTTAAAASMKDTPYDRYKIKKEQK